MGDVLPRSRVNETKGVWPRCGFRSPEEGLETLHEFGLLCQFLLTQTPVTMYIVPVSLEGCCCCDNLAKASASLLSMAWVYPPAPMQTLLHTPEGTPLLPRGRHGNIHFAKQKQTDKKL